MSIMVIIMMSIINRIRGGGLWGDRLPGHPRFWCAPVVFLLAVWWLPDWKFAAWFALAWFGWSLHSWGNSYMLGRPRFDGEPVGSMWEGLIDLGVIGLVAGLLICLLTPWALLLTVAMPASYYIGWVAFDLWPERLKAQTAIAETLMGAAWGAVLVAI